MDKANIKLFMVFCLIALIGILPTGIVVGKEGPFAEIREEIVIISETERENLQNLFVLSQQIIELEKLHFHFYSKDCY